MRIECLGEEELLEVLPAVESVYRHCYSVALSGLVRCL
jgi:hypothetical protein